ncbi:hypothetical protein DPMN_181811 [Dreissena polymorpha]|uniref:Uncharacterized protein n=1 Tax=Dreissena polymorpha TaxID=45954 RepID=A0A9D4I203_DREPO|nr:hypothetical protein DPMN_181811 [Dreissena polymorpha]
MSVESSPPQPHCGYVSDIKALEIIESTLTSAQIAKYCAAFLSGIELEDKVFQTWQMYKQKSSTPAKVSAKKIANDKFPLPKQIIAFPIKRKSHSSNGFFAITADELYNETIAKSEENKIKIIEKEQRKIAREKQKILKQNMPKKNSKGKDSKRARY